MDLAITLILLVIYVIIFLILTFIGVFIKDKLINRSDKFNFEEFLPRDEIFTLKQVFYLIMMAACFVNFFYSLIFIGGDLIYFALFDLVLSLYIAITLDKSSLKNKILMVLLVPMGALSYLLFGGADLFVIFEVIHIFIFLYFIKWYFDKFMEYTESNGLGVTIILLFSIIFISFLITQFVENKNPLDSLVMVSNAFTSNGYAVLGESIAGKINSLFLVWGGYIISGAGTATLTAAILLKHFNKRVNELERIIEERDDE